MPVTDLPAKVQALTDGMGVRRCWQSQSKAFFQALDCTRKVVKFSFAEFPDQVKFPSTNILDEKLT